MNTNINTAPLQLDLLGYTGLKTSKTLRTVLDHVDRLAKFHDSQNHRGAVISITPTQATALARTLQTAGREMRWRGHPLRVFSE
jgi:hypothetical protein